MVGKLDRFKLATISSMYNIKDELDISGERKTKTGDIIQYITVGAGKSKLYVSINLSYPKDSLVKYAYVKILSKKYEFESLTESVYTNNHHKYVLEALEIKYRKDKPAIIDKIGHNRYKAIYYKYWNKLVREQESEKGFKNMYELCMCNFFGEIPALLEEVEYPPF